MDPATWTAVDELLTRTIVRQDDALAQLSDGVVDSELTSKGRRRLEDSQRKVREASLDRELGLQLNDGSLYKAKGRIETVSGVVDPVTGTVQIKALFPNPDRELLSGSIGNVILQNPKTEAVTIPMTATVELQDKIIAYRLKNGQAEAAYLTVDRLNDGNRFIVKEGLSVGDTIVAEGVGLVREGMSITPKNETK